VDDLAARVEQRDVGLAERLGRRRLGQAAQGVLVVGVVQDRRVRAVHRQRVLDQVLLHHVHLGQLFDLLELVQHLRGGDRLARGFGLRGDRVLRTGGGRAVGAGFAGCHQNELR
jgi:hypothetical protein